MLHIIVYSLLIFLTLLAICDIIGSCVRTGDEKRRYVIFAAPYFLVKNKLKGMRKLREEAEGPEEKPAAPPTISETV